MTVSVAAMCIMSRANPSCSSLTKSDPAWHRPGDIKFEAKQYLCCINTNTTTIQTLQMEHFVRFPRLTGHKDQELTNQRF